MNSIQKDFLNKQSLVIGMRAAVGGYGGEPSNAVSTDFPTQI
jgi:hypothetical protein